VTVRNEDNVKVVDLTTNPGTIVAERFIGVQPDTMQLTKTGTLVVGPRGTPAQLALLDTATLTVRFVDLPGHVTTGHQWLSAGDRFTFIAVETPGAIAVVDNEAGRARARVPLSGWAATARGLLRQRGAAAAQRAGEGGDALPGDADVATRCVRIAPGIAWSRARSTRVLPHPPWWGRARASFSSTEA
jgi:hypothetical protein